MDEGMVTLQWPRDNLQADCFVHEVLSFRYHWHPDQYEMNILLHGQQYCCRGKENVRLSAGDVIVIDPNRGHASYGQTQNTIALVLHFSKSALRFLVPKGKELSFEKCLSNDTTRNSPAFRRIRALAAGILLTDAAGGPYAQYAIKARTEMLIAELCTHFDPEVVDGVPEVDLDTQQAMRFIMSYIEEHYAERITLEDIARLTQYNRTYISTLFHKTVGTPFYTYLSRVRLQNAIRDLVMTDKTLTDVALTNGFADLKSFNLRFRELVQCLPSDYRKAVLVSPPVTAYTARKVIPIDDPFVKEQLMAYAEGDL